MAKSKHAAALFEVIHSGRDGSQRPLLSTPRWWFKRRPREASDPTQQPVRAADLAATSEDPIAQTPSPSSPTTGTGRESGVAVDPERQVITFRLSYTSALITGFTVIVVVALAYIVGQKMSRGPSPAIASMTTDQLRAGPSNPEVLNVTPRVINSTPAIPEADSGTSSRGPETNPEQVESSTEAPSASGRQLHLNYVIIQSYPDEKSALEARDALISSGIGCSVEQKLRGYTANWYTVVGTKGFVRTRNNPEYDAYIKQIDKVSQQFAQSKRSFKAFAPMAYKWDRP